MSADYHRGRGEGIVIGLAWSGLLALMFAAAKWIAFG